MIRSLLYVPANVEAFVAKAHTRGADAIILDLEDAVAPDQKTQARACLAQAVPAVGQGGALVFVRVNAGARLWDDAEAACRAGAFGLYVPKVQSAAQLLALDEHLAPIEQALGREPMQFVPLLEDPGAVLDAREIVCAPRVYAVCAGGEDLATALGGEPDPEVLMLPKLLIHYAARAAGVYSFGLLRTVADYRDIEGIRASAAQARRHGFDGASCVHPSVVPLLNEAFGVSDEAVTQARALVAAAESAGKGAFVFEGRMVDAPIITRAQALIARYERYAK